MIHAQTNNVTDLPTHIKPKRNKNNSNNINGIK